MRTECGNCLFFNKKCELGRHEKWELLEVEGKIFVDKFCNAKRHIKWKDRYHSVDDVLREIFIRVDVVITKNYEECYKKIQNLKLNHVYLIGTENLPSYPGVTSIRVFDGDLIKTVIPKLSGEYVLILEDPFDFDLEKLNNRINLDLEKIPYIQYPFFVNKALLTIINRDSSSFDTIKEKLNTLGDNIKQW